MLRFTFWQMVDLISKQICMVMHEPEKRKRKFETQIKWLNESHSFTYFNNNSVEKKIL